jgi:hypothetical protein
MGFEELVEQAREAQYSHLWVDVTALKALIRERDLLKAENEALKADVGRPKAGDGAPKATFAHPGDPAGERGNVNESFVTLVRKIQALESRKILDEQRMDHLDRRLDDFIARIDEIERAHLDTAP